MSDQQTRVLWMIRQWPGATGHELAALGALNGYAITDYYAIMRRGSELRTAGVVENGDKRKCRISGRMVLTWWPV